MQVSIFTKVLLMMKIIPASAVKQKNSYLGNKFKHHNEYTNCCFIYIIASLEYHIQINITNVWMTFSWFRFTCK